MKVLFQTTDSWSYLILRVMLGLVMFPHGAQKVFGWFGGHGYSATLAGFVDNMHIPIGFAFLDIMAEFLGSLGLIIGFLTRISAFGVFCVMVVAIWMVHWPMGFFSNWFGQKKGEGFEYHLLVIGMCVALMIAGAGKYSVDGIIAKNLSKK